MSLTLQLDVGWIQTTDMMYEEHAKKIIESILDLMKEDFRIKFNWADTYFFARWYEDASDHYKMLAQEYVKSKRFYFVNGGWVMHDESTSDYRSVIDQIVVGQEFLYETFDIIPTVGWQIDSFGESAVTPSIMSMSGIDSIVNSRIGHSAKSTLIKNKYLNFMWEGHKISSDMSKHRLFTHPLMGDSYKTPSPFEFSNEKDLNCTHPYIDIKNARDFFDRVFQPHIDTYDYTDEIAIFFGADNLYSDAYMTFYCIDSYMVEIQRLIRDWTQYRWMTYRFATIEDYLQQISSKFKEEKIHLPYFKGDFVPYDQRVVRNDVLKLNQNDGYTEFWTGFYSTHPVIKQQIRDLTSQVRSLSSLMSISNLLNAELDTPNFNFNTSMAELTKIRQDSARMLDHNTITGTHPRNTYVLDYNKTITNTMSSSQKLTERIHLENLKLSLERAGKKVTL